MNRRRYLSLLGVGLVAGCMGSGEEPLESAPSGDSGTTTRRNRADGDSENTEQSGGVVLEGTLTGPGDAVSRDVRFTGGSNVTIDVSGVESHEQVTLKFDGPEPRSRNDTGDPKNFDIDRNENLKSDRTLEIPLRYDGVYEIRAISYDNGTGETAQGISVKIEVSTDGPFERVGFL